MLCRELKLGGCLQVIGGDTLAAVVEAGLSEEVTPEQGLKDEKEQATSQKVGECPPGGGNTKCKAW